MKKNQDQLKQQGDIEGQHFKKTMDNEIILQYERTDADPPILSILVQIATGIVTGIGRGLIEAGRDAMREALRLATIEKFTGAAVEYLREQAGTWAAKTIIDASNQEWMIKTLHAFGLDVEDLIEVSKNVVDKMGDTMYTSIIDGFSKAGFDTKTIGVDIGKALGLHEQATASAISASSYATTSSIDRHQELMAQAQEEMTIYQVNANREEQYLNRQTTREIFTETEDKVRARERYAGEERIKQSRGATGSWAEEELPGIAEKAKTVLRPIQDKLNEIILDTRNTIYSMLVPRLPVSYEHVGVTAASAFVSAMGLGFGAHALAVAADLLHPLKLTAVPQLAAFLADMAGFGAIARATWYEDMRNFLGIPYRYYSLRYFRPTLPREIDLQTMAVKPDIRIEDFRRAMEYHGYSDAWVNAIERTMYREPRYFELSIMLEDAHTRLDWLYKKCRRAGYTPEDADIFVEGLLSKVLRPYFAAYRMAVMKNFKEGYINEAQFDQFLIPLRLRSEAHALLKKAARLEYIYDYTSDTIKMFTDMYDKDLITREDFELSLNGLGIRPERVELIINRVDVKKRARVAREEERAVKAAIRKRQSLLTRLYILSYQSGHIDKDKLISLLEFAGIDTELATITAELEEEKRQLVETRKAFRTIETEQQRTAKKYEKGYIDLFRKDLITSDVLRQHLLGLGFEEDYVDAVVYTEQIKKLQPASVME